MVDDMTFQDILEDPRAISPECHIEMIEFTDNLAASIDQLNNKEQLIISLFYYEGLTQKEIAEVLDLTEGRISQLHSQALHKLRVKMDKRLQNQSDSVSHA
jgi:RNA polymerase sigma factor for flagellar operon FliA